MPFSCANYCTFWSVRRAIFQLFCLEESISKIIYYISKVCKRFLMRKQNLKNAKICCQQALFSSKFITEILKSYTVFVWISNSVYMYDSTSYSYRGNAKRQRRILYKILCIFTFKCFLRLVQLSQQISKKKGYRVHWPIN